MNKDTFNSFFEETQQVFGFLETEFGYKFVSMDVEHIDDPRDTTAFVRYVGKQAGIEVSWYPAGGSIGVALIALQKEGEFPSKKRFVSDARGEANAISLHTLADMLGKDDLFLLNKWKSARFAHARKRERIISESMTAVLENLAGILKELAHDIVLGDTSIFPRVQEHEMELAKKLHPGFF